MYIEAVVMEDFRGLNCRVPLSDPLAILAGENNAGKSSVIDALRLVTAPYHDYRSRPQVTMADFAHDGTGNRTADSFAVSIELADLSLTERGRMATCLTPRVGSNTARLTFRAQLTETERIVTSFTGGDLANRDIEAFAKSAIKNVYLHPLRDAAKDLRPGHANRLGELISAFAPVDGTDRQTLEDIINTANSSLATVPAVINATGAIAASLGGLTGTGSFAQVSDLQFSPARYERIVSTLRALMGRLAPLELDENGLGFNNVLYMAVLLSVLQNADEAPLQLLLVEEPEAHLHPQLQDLLMQYLEEQSSEGTQVILTTHSPQLASSARVERLTVMSPSSAGNRTAHHLGSIGVSQDKLDYLRRFLDVTKSSLLFAKGVILVEGIAEQLLMPEFASKLGLSLTRSGISVVNVGGLSFAAFAALFQNGGLPVQCAIVTDGDPTIAKDDDGNLEEYDVDDLEQSATARSIAAQAGPNVQPFISTRTLEWDLAFHAGGVNREMLLEALKKVRPRKAEELHKSTAEPQEWADSFLAAVKKTKGDFAQNLAMTLATSKAPFEVPDYVAEALMWITAQTGEVSISDPLGAPDPTKSSEPESGND